MTVKSLPGAGGGMGLQRRGRGGGLQTVMATGAGAASNEAGVNFFYGRLMQVAVNDTFYNTENGRCADFTIEQVRHTQRLCRSLGMIVRNEGAGFSVLYDTLRTEGLVRYLRSHSSVPAQMADDGAGTRLSFALTLHNPDFCYFTDIPFDIDPNECCYYLSNRAAHDENGRVVLNALAYVPQSLPLPAVDGQYDVPFPQDATEIEVRDVLGNVVQCYPREVPVALVEADPAAIDSCGKVKAFLKAHPGARTETRAICTINFYLLPAGCYTIAFVGSVQEQVTVVYRAEFYEALCFIDLFLANPERGGPGIFPIDDLSMPDPVIRPVAYNLDFAARSTFWDYLIVPPARGATLHDLQITRRGGAPVDFSAAMPVEIGLDTTAWLTSSQQPLPIQSTSDFDLRLSGRIQYPGGMTGHDTTLMPRLPVAPPDWALPLDPPRATPAAGPNYGKSAIYVYL